MQYNSAVSTTQEPWQPGVGDTTEVCTTHTQNLTNANIICPQLVISHVSRVFSCVFL